MSEPVVDLTPRIRAEQLASREHTDIGNAERLALSNGDRLRFIPGRGWHGWDGQRWKPDGDGEVMRRMKQTIDAMREEAAKQQSDDKREALWKHAKRSAQLPRLKAAVELAQSDSMVIADSLLLDADPYLLTVGNGTLDLRTGELLSHNPDHLVTKLAPVDFDPDARDERWTSFLHETTGGDAELLGFLQRFAGYCLTGDTSEEKLFLAHGPAGTGKSTFLEALKATLGEYAATADFETFLRRPSSAGPRSGLAQLAGARLVVSSEVDRGKRMAEALVKTITGGDTVRGAFLYQDSFEFVPAFKLCLAANHAPEVSDDDDAMWRRILRVPFEQQVPPERRDRSLKAHLRQPNAAVLAWALEGCLVWRREGLGMPGAVERATADYRREMDPLADFLEGRCELREGSTATSDALQVAYTTWARDTGEQHPLAKAELWDRLKGLGCVRDRPYIDGKQVRVWHGIAVR